MPALRFPFDRQMPEFGTTMVVAPGVLWHRMPLPFALNHVNLWLLQDGDGWCAVDTGLTWHTIQEIWEKLLPLYPLTRQIVTHYHPDHIGLAGWLEQKTGAKMWTTQGEYTGALAFAEEAGSFFSMPFNHS